MKRVCRARIIISSLVHKYNPTCKNIPLFQLQPETTYYKAITVLGSNTSIQARKRISKKRTKFVVIKFDDGTTLTLQRWREGKTISISQHKTSPLPTIIATTGGLARSKEWDKKVEYKKIRRRANTNSGRWDEVLLLEIDSVKGRLGNH